MHIIRDYCNPYLTAQLINLKNLPQQREYESLKNLHQPGKVMTSIWELISINKDMTCMRLVIITRMKIKQWVNRTSEFIIFYIENIRKSSNQLLVERVAGAISGFACLEFFSMMGDI